MAKKKRVFTVGPNMGYIGHSVDMVNYYPGQKFNIDHIDDPDLVQSLIDRGAIVEVTGMAQKQIDKMVSEYKPLTQAEIKAALEASQGNG